MKAEIYLIIVLAIFIKQSRSFDIPELNEDNFDKYLNGNNSLLVNFYSTYCGFCRAFAPEFEKAGEKGMQHNPIYVMAKVEINLQRKLAANHNIRFVPTVILYIKGEKKGEYNGPRLADNIITFIESFNGA